MHEFREHRNCQCERDHLSVGYTARTFHSDRCFSRLFQRVNSFSVAVDVCNASNVLADFLNFRFTPGVVSAIGVVEGDFLRQGGATLFFSGSIDNTGVSLPRSRITSCPQ
jgi:hypothetical protein